MTAMTKNVSAGNGTTGSRMLSLTSSTRAMTTRAMTTSSQRERVNMTVGL